MHPPAAHGRLMLALSTKSGAGLHRFGFDLRESLLSGATPEPELIPEIYVKTGFQDAWSIRFGGTRDLEELDAQLYLGSFYETGASSELGITPASMDLDKVGISAGWHQVLAAG